MGANEEVDSIGLRGVVCCSGCEGINDEVTVVVRNEKDLSKYESMQIQQEPMHGTIIAKGHPSFAFKTIGDWFDWII